MSNPPTDLTEYRRSLLQKRIARARRLLTLTAEIDLMNAESVAELRAFAEAAGIETEVGKDSIAFADRMANTATTSALCDAARTEIVESEASLARLSGPSK